MRRSAHVPRERLYMRPEGVEGKALAMKVVYIAGPYRAPSEYEVVQNIRRAEALALEVWRAGAAAICPHMNTALWGGAADDSVWLRGDLEILRRCDAMVCAPNWRQSKGACGEVALARELGLPVFETIVSFESWFREGGEDS
jgi:hypothetical protein